ncbi:hypothetical protein BKI52_13830 [marine bacterium AO1-C]|nr:hypothetical protein BKI52_13830 [marine bacterium AO1-C]
MKFNTKAKNSNVVANYMGGKSFKLDPATELYTAVVTTMLDDSYYEKAGDRLKRIKALVAKNNPAFVAKLAIYAREKMNLRTIPQVLMVELAKVHSGDSLVSETLPRVVRRADEITELLAYYSIANTRNGIKKLNKLSKQLQKGLAMAFNQFDEYQFAKYNRQTAVSLKDALFVVHPKPKNTTQQEVFDKIVNGNLATPYTWETQLSQLGQQAFDSDVAKIQAKAKLWEELVTSGKVGYMALLRNLRNIIVDGTDVALDNALTVLADKTRVAKSKQLPFRFLSAYVELEKLRKQQGMFSEKTQQKLQNAIAAVGQAAIFSVDNLPYMGGKTLILSDNSGSMYGDRGGNSLVSAFSKRTSADIANLFAVLYWAKSPDTHIGLFGDRLVTPDIQRRWSVFDNFDKVSKAATKCGGATETGIFTMMKKLLKDKTKVDRIIIFSDCQVGTGCNWFGDGFSGSDFNKLFQQYKKQINPEVVTYSVDLRGYGNTLFSDGVMTIGGWSNKIFDMMYALENGSTVMQEIMNV